MHFEKYINSESRTKDNKRCDSWILDENCDYNFHVCIGDENNPCSFADKEFGTFQDAPPILYLQHEIDVTFKLYHTQVSY